MWQNTQIFFGIAVFRPQLPHVHCTKTELRQCQMKSSMFHHIHTNLFQLNANKEKNVISQNEMRQPEKLTSSGHLV